MSRNKFKIKPRRQLDDRPAAAPAEPEAAPAEPEAAPAEPKPPGGVVDRVVASLSPGWASFAASLRDLDCKPMQVQMEIDGLLYTNTKLPTSLGLEVWPRITALIGAGLERVLATGEGMGELGLDVVIHVAQAAMAQGLTPTIRDLLSRTDVDKRRDTSKPGPVVGAFDSHFAGEYAHLICVCVFALVHNLRGPTYGAR